jgi:hypothetical protein
MKVSVDDIELFTLTETQKKVIQNDIPTEIFQDDMCRRLQYILTHKYEQCHKRLKEEWEPKLKSAGLKSIPLDDQEFAELVFTHPEYKNRTQREAEVPKI